MASTEILSIKWNDFHENIAASFRELRDDIDFKDVTLACEDGQQIEAHKNILSICSSVFKNILKQNKKMNPIIYLRGVQLNYLTSMLEFIYNGETNINEDNLDEFLAIASEFKLKGLVDVATDPPLEEDSKLNARETVDMDLTCTELPEVNNMDLVQNPEYQDLGNAQVDQQEQGNAPAFTNHLDIKPSNSTDSETPRQKRKYTKRGIANKGGSKTEETISKPKRSYNKSSVASAVTGKIAIKIEQQISNEELDVKIESLMTLGEPFNHFHHGPMKQWVCTVCGLKNRDKSDMVNHIEGQHIEGVIHPCNQCGKPFR